MEILFLGTGTSTGVPSLCCTCEVCLSEDERNKRLRSSILVRRNGHTILVDTSTDLRQQCLRYNIQNIDTVLYTHHHADHVHGIDELRSFNFFNKITIPCYGNQQTLDNLKKNFSYIFGVAEQIGGGIPQLVPHTFENKTYKFGDIEVTPLDIQHGKLMINGFRFFDCAYITDCSGIPGHTMEKLKGLKVLILNALGFKDHATHFNLSQALEAAKEIKAERTILTHINHQYDFETVSKDLPESVELAVDGMKLTF
ncbi:MAG: MBL fold metallo-hydrolase [Nitrospinota bacterium]